MFTTCKPLENSYCLWKDKMNNMRNIVVKADGGGSFWHQSPKIDCTKSMEVRDE